MNHSTNTIIKNKIYSSQYGAKDFYETTYEKKASQSPIE